MEQIPDSYDLCVIFYALFNPSQFIKPGLINFKTQGNIPVFIFSTSTLSTTILRPTLDFENIVHFWKELIIMLNIEDTVPQTE